MSDFRDRLKIAIKASGKSWEEIAKISGVSKRTIDGWLKKTNPKTPKIDQGASVAQVVGESLDYLATGNPPAGITERAFSIAHDYDSLDAEGQQSIDTSMEGLLLAHRKVVPETGKAVSE
ncbi:hypothetical protein AGMMS49944_16280 [Spirochaetia bacterium]|nr:hypothetical protein AGMMS49944_16280 [Spirochaetia bacterium]